MAYTSTHTGQQIDNFDERISQLENFMNTVYDTVYPIGSIYISINSISPATLFGGTWEALGGQFLLAANSTYTAGSTGGSATMAHTHTLAHTHSIAHTHTLAHTHSIAHTHTYSHTHTTPATTSGGPSNNSTSSVGDHAHYLPIGWDSNNMYTNSSIGGGTVDTGDTVVFGAKYASSGARRYMAGSYGAGGHSHTLNSHTHSTGGVTTNSQSATTTSAASAANSGAASTETTSAASNANSGAASTETTSAASNANNMPPYLAVYMWKRTA